MPSKTKRQARTMRAAAHNAEYARKMNIPQDVAREFARSDAPKRKSHSIRTKIGDSPE